MVKRHVPDDVRRLVKELLDKTEPAKYEPTAEQIAVRVQELEAMGLKNESELIGISSPMRQYAINSLCNELAQQHAEPGADAFVTMDPDLLRLADRLAERYGLRVISIEEFVRQMDEKGGKALEPTDQSRRSD